MLWRIALYATLRADAVAFYDTAGGVGLLIDGFAERWAEPYTAALLQRKANVMVQHADSTATQPADTSSQVKH
ncbi:hypothetical protein [Musicola keenii]|uniref:hypothetical protein n=1 Tax=Musicola keenii TaxID=2884250 RepID=UPI00177AB1A8|nr:hypothetical protein [Musicola keenii]